MKQRRSRLKEFAEKILGNNYFNRFYDFFKSIICSEQSAEKEYIAIITRRCSCLMYIFLQILRDDTGEDWMTNADYDDKRIFITESALINKGWSIGQMLLNGNIKNLPKIVLIDDSIAYGRALSNTLEQLEEQIKYSIESCTDSLQKSIAYKHFDEFKENNISIQICVQRKQIYILPKAYYGLLKVKTSLEPTRWNSLSIRLSELISNVNVANAAFVLSKGIDQIPPTPDDGWIQINQNYRGHRQKVFLLPFKSKGGNYKAVGAVRCIECSTIDNYRLIPFIFLPPLTERQIEKIENRIFAIFLGAGIFNEYDKEEMQREVKEIVLKSRLDFITMYLSLSILYIFEKASGTFAIGSERYDLEKVLWHYSDTPHRFCALKKMVNGKNQKEFLSLMEIREIIDGIETDRYISDFIKASELGFMDEDKQCKLNTWIEEYLFYISIEVEHEAHKCVLNSTRVGEYTIGKLSDIRYDCFFDFLEKLREYVKENGHEFSSLELIAGVFQMMDAGLMSIVSAPLKNEESLKMVSHQIRICEAAIGILPQRYYLYCDKINDLSEGKWLKEDEIEKRLKEYFDVLYRNNLLRENDKNQEDFVQKLKKYLISMRYAAQNISYWMVGINRHYEIKKPGQGIDLIITDSEMLKKRIQYKNAGMPDAD